MALCKPNNAGSIATVFIPGRTAGQVPCSAFTFMEVLVTMVIFTVGIVAIAAIFPVAAILQRETIEDVAVQHVRLNALALLEARGIQESQMLDGLAGRAFDTDERVYPLPRQILQSGGTNPTRWTLADRSYPSEVPLTDTNGQYGGRQYFWVPLVRDRDGRDNSFTADYAWEIYVFILRRDSRADYVRQSLNQGGTWANFNDNDNVPANPVPGVRSVAVNVVNPNRFEFDRSGFNRDLDQIISGAQVLDAFGRAYSVIRADADGFDTLQTILDYQPTGDDPRPMTPDTIWFVPLGGEGKLNPARLVATILDSPIQDVVR